MNLRDHDEDDGKKVWLSTTGTPSEVEQLIAHPDHVERSLAFALGARCGLRSAEILEVTPEDVVESDAGTVLRVWEGKGGKYRETPVPRDLQMRIETIAGVRDAGADVPLIESVETTRSLRRWIEETRAELAAETGDAGWRYLSLHDLRRTWATALSDAGVEALHALEWGGWEDIETFLDHYKGAYSPESRREEREKVEWL